MYIKGNNITIMNNMILVSEIKKNRIKDLSKLGIISKSFIIEIEQEIERKTLICNLN